MEKTGWSFYLNSNAMQCNEPNKKDYEERDEGQKGKDGGKRIKEEGWRKKDVGCWMQVEGLWV